jgi:hypothetical protein
VRRNHHLTHLDLLSNGSAEVKSREIIQELYCPFGLGNSTHGAKEKALRLKAEMAFLAAGGARGDFAREWPSVFLEEVRGARTSAAWSGG